MMNRYAAAILAALALPIGVKALAQTSEPDRETQMLTQISIAEKAAEIAISGLPTDEYDRQLALVDTTRGLDEALRQQLLHLKMNAPFPCVSHHFTAIFGECRIAFGYGALINITTGNNDMAYGHCSGASLMEESNDLLIGDYTAAPLHKNGFVNIENKLCFWRETGKRADCPPPEPECMKQGTK